MKYKLFLTIFFLRLRGLFQKEFVVKSVYRVTFIKQTAAQTFSLDFSELLQSIILRNIFIWVKELRNFMQKLCVKPGLITLKTNSTINVYSKHWYLPKNKSRNFENFPLNWSGMLTVYKLWTQIPWPNFLRMILRILENL